jgi:FtsH-binding integral membrane protein
MNQNDPKHTPEKQAAGPLGMIGITVLGLFLFASFAGFIKVLVTEGPSSAMDRAPGGFIVFLVISAILYIFTTAYLADKGQKNIARVMAWLGAAALGLFVLTVIPTCSNQTSGPAEIYYRR